MFDTPRKLRFYHLIVLVALFVFAVSTTRSAEEKDGLLKVYFLDIGQGDAEFIQAPNGTQVLIDGGPDNSVVSRLSEVMSFYDHDIDVVVASHPHSDHIAGLVDVLERYDVETIIQAGESYESAQFKAWSVAVANEQAQNIDATAGTQIDLGSGATLTILHPFASVVGTATDEPHDDVVVTLLTYGKTKVLFTGDMEKDVETKLVERFGALLDADVLKIGHHGSKTSSSETFLAQVSPRTAVISVGAKNRYHHPSPDVTTRLEKFGVPYYRTDIDGTVKLESDGNFIQLSIQ